jgi:3-isopropylmalate dehydrogenase
MTYKVAVLPGDGIGPEIMEQALRVLATLNLQEVLQLSFGDIGGIAYDRHGTHYPDETHRLCQSADAVLFGSVGGPVEEAMLPKWKNCEANSILALRKNFKLNVNLRPAKLYPCLLSISPLKERIVAAGIDLLVVRELVGDIYFGEHTQYNVGGLRAARDVAEYREDQIRIAAHHAFQAALYREKKVTSVDKANVLATSKLWREIVNEVATEYSEVKLEHMLVDNCAMQLLLNPKQFDVILTANLFGDILSDAASAIPGSLGLMPSASLSETGFGLYEPAGGSAPNLANQNKANPIGQILSLAMMLRYSFALQVEAGEIENAVTAALAAGFRTEDIYAVGMKKVGTAEMTDAIIKAMF